MQKFGFAESVLSRSASLPCRVCVYLTVATENTDIQKHWLHGQRLHLATEVRPIIITEALQLCLKAYL